MAPRFDAAYLRNPQPIYPLMSRKYRECGTVVLRVQVGTDGRVIQAGVKTTSGHGRLDHSALFAVKQWVFVPARSGLDSVIAWVEVPITFSLVSS